MLNPSVNLRLPPRQRLLVSAPQAAVLGIVLVVALGVMHGVVSGRWSSAASLGNIAAVRDKQLINVGAWQGTDAPPLSAPVLKTGGILEYIQRTYRHRQTGQSVQVLVVAGWPRDITVHSPEVCFRGAGQEQLSTRTLKTFDDFPSGMKPSFYVADFGSVRDAVSVRQRVHWAWNDGKSGWIAPGDPRVKFGGRRTGLYKLYVVTEADDAAEPKEFLSHFLSRFDEVVFQTPDRES